MADQTESLAEQPFHAPRNCIAVLDFGGQYAHLIVNRVRRLNAFAELFHADVTADELRQHHVTGIIFSGGGGSVTGEECPLGVQLDSLLDLHVPILGLCLGHQYLANALGGTVTKDEKMKEYGPAMLTIMEKPEGEEGPWILEGLDKGDDGERKALSVWMSHGESVNTLPTR